MYQTRCRDNKTTARIDIKCCDSETAARIEIKYRDSETAAPAKILRRRVSAPEQICSHQARQN